MRDVMRSLRLLHRWLGLLLALPMIMMAATGLILAMTPVFDDLGAPPPSRAEGAVHSPEEILAAVQGALPAGRLQLGGGDRAIATVDLVRPGQRMAEARLLIDPVTLAVVVRHDRPGRFYAWVHGLHEFLLIPGPVGRSVIGCCGIGLFLAGLIGIPLWWPAKLQVRQAITVSPRAKGLRFQRQLHGAAGFWLVAMLLVQSFAGITMAFPDAARAAFGVAGSPGFPRAQGRPEQLDLPAAIRSARARLPGASLRIIVLPTTAGRPVLLWFRPDGEGADAPLGLVAVDPAGPVLAVQDPRTATGGMWMLATLRRLHSADGFGPVWRAMVCLAGAGLATLSVTGAAMWLLRQRNRRRIARQRQSALQTAHG